MNCLEFRRAVGADPNFASAESLAHRAQCPACEQYAQETLRLDGLIKRALQVPVRKEVGGAAPHLQPRRSRQKWFAMAASVVLMLSVAAGAISLLGYPRESLAAEGVAHLAHEPQARAVSQLRVSAQLLDGALKAKGLRLAEPLSDVSYLESCWIRGHFVPHLVVQTERGPVTVLLFTDEEIQGVQHFDEQNYHGMLVPMSRGAMAVIATDASVVELVAQRVKAAIAQ